MAKNGLMKVYSKVYSVLNTLLNKNCHLIRDFVIYFILKALFLFNLPKEVTLKLGT